MVLVAGDSSALGSSSSAQSQISEMVGKATARRKKQAAWQMGG